MKKRRPLNMGIRRLRNKYWQWGALLMQPAPVSLVTPRAAQ